MYERHYLTLLFVCIHVEATPVAEDGKTYYDYAYKEMKPSNPKSPPLDPGCGTPYHGTIDPHIEGYFTEINMTLP